MSIQTYQFQIVIPQEIISITQIIKRAGGRGYLVGGIVRDAVIQSFHDIPVLHKDYDIEVFGLSMSQLQSVLEKELNVPISLEGKDYQVLKVHKLLEGEPIDVSVAREEESTGKGHNDFIVTENPDLTLDEAAHRRDLSINALYYDPLGEEIYDCYGGYEDIQQGKLDIINADRFVEDPLRVLRVMQFAGRFGFQPTEGLIQTGQKIVEEKMLEHLPTERVSEEFLKWSYHSINPGLGLSYLKDIGALSFIASFVADLTTTKQTLEWHPEGSVWIHTLQCVNAGADIATREKLSPFEKAILLLGSFCHDLGKTTTTEFRQDRNVYTSYGHHLASEEMASALLERLGLPNYIRDSVPLLVKHHMQLRTLFMNERNGQDQTKAFQRLQRELNDTNVTIDMLLWLAEADMRARNPAGNMEPLERDEVDDFLAIKKWTEDKLCFLENTGENERDIITGSYLLQIIDEPEGPWVGAMKELVHDFVTDGQVQKTYERPELFAGDGRVQEKLVALIYSHAVNLVSSSEFSWKNVSEQADQRDVIIEDILKRTV